MLYFRKVMNNVFVLISVKDYCAFYSGQYKDICLQKLSKDCGCVDITWHIKQLLIR